MAITESEGWEMRVGLWRLETGTIPGLAPGDSVEVEIVAGCYELRRPGGKPFASIPFDSALETETPAGLGGRVVLRYEAGRIDATLSPSPAIKRPSGSDDAPERATVPCFNCGAYVSLPSDATEFTCAGCGTQRAIRRCLRCPVLAIIGSDRAGDEISHVCRHADSFEGWLAGPTASAADWVTENGRWDPDPDRRQVTGTVVTAVGLRPLANTIGCRLAFERDHVAVLALIKDRGYTPIASVEWSEARFVRVGSQDAAPTRTGNRQDSNHHGAGLAMIDPQEFARDLATLSADASTPQTLLHFGAGPREVAMLVPDVAPDVLRARLKAPVARLDAALELLLSKPVAAVLRATEAPATPAVRPSVAKEVGLPCGECGAIVALASGSVAYTCPGCSTMRIFRRCHRCSRVVPVKAGAIGTKRGCGYCGHEEDGERWAARTAATASEWAAETSQALLADPDRREISGLTIAATGLPPLAERIGCLIAFHARGVGINALIERRRYGVIAIIQWSDISFLRVGGRGAMTSTAGGGWIGGGFGVGGALEGAAVAQVLNAMTRKTTTSMETIVHLGAGPREVMLLNQTLTPQVVGVRLAPAVARIEAAKAAGRVAVVPSPPSPNEMASSTSDRLNLLRQLGELHASGVLTDPEFEAEKVRILNRSN